MNKMRHGCEMLMSTDKISSRIPLIVILALAGALGIACSPETNGTPSTPTSEQSGPNDTRHSESEPDGPAENTPLVANPLDASHFIADPCAVLDQEQLASLGVTRPGIPETTGAVAEQVGPFCSWHASAEEDSTIGVGFVTGNNNGLSDTYRGRDQFEDFRPTEIDEYPAVFANSPDLRSSGMCNIVVGVSDSLAFSATEQGSLDASGSCDRAEQVATAALATIQEGS
ncbi:DUF3558 domain-containing protein [Actinophytocola sediminis]